MSDFSTIFPPDCLMGEIWEPVGMFFFVEALWQSFRVKFSWAVILPCCIIIHERPAAIISTLSATVCLGFLCSHRLLRIKQQ